jgi:hypothetical protein
MFRIRKIHDDGSPANRDAIAQVQAILADQFPRTRPKEIDKIPLQLRDLVEYRYRSVLFVAESGHGKVRAFAMLLHMADVQAAFLELISAASGITGGGCGGALYTPHRRTAAQGLNPATGRLQRAVVPKRVVIVDSFIPQRQREHPLTQQRHLRMLATGLTPRILQRPGHRSHQPNPPIGLPQQQDAPSELMSPPEKSALTASR